MSYPHSKSAAFRPMTDELLEEVVERVVDAFAPEQVIFFGSYGDHGTPGVVLEQ